VLLNGSRESISRFFRLQFGSAIIGVYVTVIITCVDGYVAGPQQGVIPLVLRRPLRFFPLKVELNGQNTIPSLSSRPLRFPIILKFPAEFVVVSLLTTFLGVGIFAVGISAFNFITLCLYRISAITTYDFGLQIVSTILYYTIH